MTLNTTTVMKLNSKEIETLNSAFKVLENLKDGLWAGMDEDARRKVTTITEKTAPTLQESVFIGRFYYFGNKGKHVSYEDIDKMMKLLDAVAPIMEIQGYGEY